MSIGARRLEPPFSLPRLAKLCFAVTSWPANSPMRDPLPPKQMLCRLGPLLDPVLAVRLAPNVLLDGMWSQTAQVFPPKNGLLIGQIQILRHTRGED